MRRSNINPHLLERYRKILEIEPAAPNLETLTSLVKAQMRRIPFENISKLYYMHRRDLRGLIDFELFLDGIEAHNFGGTCYSTNYYFAVLLRSLGYEVKLCGADMANPDVHIVSMVKLDSREYLVDVGYAAPFLEPMPVDLEEDYEIRCGDDKYVLKPRDENGRSRMDMYRGGELLHGYSINQNPREIGYFENVIADSFGENATFMNAVLLVRFYDDRILSIRNLTVLEAGGTESRIRKLANRAELVENIETLFGISAGIADEAVRHVNTFKDAWD